jgi:CIC family chloride channel protein
VPDVAAGARPLFLLLGIVMGLAGVFYNTSLLVTLVVAERVPVEARAALIGATVGALAWAYPDIVGGGEDVTQNAIGGGQALPLLAIVLLIRFVLSPFSYAANTPGGIFAPLLAIGALLGVLYGDGCRWAWPGLDEPDASFALVGMASFFVGVVRSPLTGMVLVSEMTGNVTLLLPMLGACAFAMAVPTLLRDPPIYDSLRVSLLSRERAFAKPEVGDPE